MAELIGKDPNVVESLDKDLEALQPQDNTIEFQGRTIHIHPYKFKNLLKALKHIGNLVEVLELASVKGAEVAMLQGFSQHGDDILALINLSTGLTDEDFEELDSDVGFDLAVKVYKVNESFFVKNLLPKLQEFGLFQPEVAEEEKAETTEDQTPKKAPQSKRGSTSSKN
jgi:hypothetical protein